MNLEQWYTIQAEDWRELERQFQDSYLPVLRFVTENKGSFAEARDVYIEAFYYYTRSVELKGKSYLKNASGLIYSFSRIIWLKKLEKRNVDLSLVQHHREFYDLDETFHEIDLMTERSAKAAATLAEIGEPCRTMMIEFIGKGKSFEEVGPRLGFSVEERAHTKLSSCLRKLVELTENKVFKDSEDQFDECLKYVLNPDSSEKPQGKEAEICLAITSRVVATIKNHVGGNERTATLREFRDRLLQDDAKLLQKIDSKPNKLTMKPLQLVATVAFVAIIVSGLTTFAVNNISFETEQETPVVDSLETAIDTLEAIPEIVWEERSAFIINADGYALTSAGDLNRGQKIEAGNSEIDASAKVVAVDKHLGVALIKVDSSLISKVSYKFSLENAVVGEDLFSLGFSENNILYSEAHTQMVEKSSQKVSGRELEMGAPLLSAKGELKGMIISADEGNKSIGVVELRDFISNHVVEDISLPKRNLIYYDKTPKKVEKLSPCILKVKFQV